MLIIREFTYEMASRVLIIREFTCETAICAALGGLLGASWRPLWASGRLLGASWVLLDGSWAPKIIREFTHEMASHVLILREITCETAMEVNGAQVEIHKANMC